MRNPTRFALKKFAFFMAGLALALNSVSHADSSRRDPKSILMSACTKNTARVNLCLGAYLDYQCRNYGTLFAGTSPRTLRCIQASRKMVSLLDITQVSITDPAELNSNDPNERSGLLLKQIFFTKKLESLFGQPSTAKRIKGYSAALSEAYRFGRPVNLWNLENSHAKDKDDALEFIAVILQDASEGMGHLTYFRKKFEKQEPKENSPEARNFVALQDFLVELNSNKLQNDQTPEFSLYPERGGFEKNIHPYVHHFYLSAYLARQLRKSGFGSQEAFFVAFLLNASYEFTKLDVKLGTKNWPLRDPPSFPSGSQSLQTHKIYSGYLGAMLGVGHEWEAEDYATFEKEFSKDPHGKMESLFKISFLGKK